MRWLILLGVCLLVLSGTPMDSAQAGGERNLTSLGELACQLKAERAKSEVKPAKLFTNDDIPATTTPAVVGSVPALAQRTTAGEASILVDSGHDTSSENFYRQRARKLRNQLEIDQRTLEGLKEAMGGKAQEGFYQWLQTTNPAIFFEFFGKLPKESTDILDRAEARIESDKKVISDLEEQCRRARDCKPDWLR